MIVAGIIAASLILFGLPGALLAIALRRHGYSPLLCAGIGAASWVVIFSNLAAIAGYSFSLFGVIYFALVIALGIWAWRERRSAAELWLAVRRVPIWQYLF